MSRKSAYALKLRDPGFMAAWNAAIGQPALSSFQGDKVDEVDRPRCRRRQGDRTSSAEMRDIFNAGVKDLLRDSNLSMLARASALP